MCWMVVAVILFVAIVAAAVLIPLAARGKLGDRDDMGKDGRGGIRFRNRNRLNDDRKLM